MNIDIDGYNIEYKKSGSGDAILILQGWGTTMDVYDCIAAWLSPKYSIYQINLPGFGSSTEPRKPWNVYSYADFVLKFIKAMNIDRISLIGHSYGGRIIIKLLAREDIDVSVDKVVLIDSAGVKARLTVKKAAKVRVYKLMKKAFNIGIINKLFKEQIDSWRSKQGSADYRAASPMMKKCMVLAINEDLTNLLPKIKQEVLLIWGDKDTATPLSDAKLMEKSIPHNGLVVLEGAGHYSFLDRAAICRRVLESYFAI